MTRGIACVILFHQVILYPMLAVFLVQIQFQHGFKIYHKREEKGWKNNSKDRTGDIGSNLIDMSAEEVLTQPDMSI